MPWESIELFPTNLLPHPEGSRYINTPGLIAFIGVSRELAASPTSSASVSGESPAPQGAGTGPPSTLVNGVAGLPGQLGGALLSTANGWGKPSHHPLNGSSSPSAGGARDAIPHGYGRKHSLLPSVMGMCRGRCRSLRSPPMTPPRQLASAHDAVLHVALQGCRRKVDTAQHILNLPLAEGREASSKSWGRKWGYSRQHCGGPTELKSSKEHQSLWSQRHRGDRTLVWYSLTCWWTLLQNDMVLWEAPRMAAEGEEANSLPALTGSIIAPHHCSCHHCHHHHTILITTIPTTTPSSSPPSPSPPPFPSWPSHPSPHHLRHSQRPHHCSHHHCQHPHHHIIPTTATSAAWGSPMLWEGATISQLAGESRQYAAMQQ